MRGGAWPPLIFASALLGLGVVNRIWESSDVMSATVAFAAAVIYLTVGALLARRGREALRRGGPAPDPSPRAVPTGSLGALVLGIGSATLAAGFVFGTSLVVFACLLMTGGIALLTRELRAQRRALRREVGR